MMSKYEAPSVDSSTQTLELSEMRAPPQNQASSMKRATCQGHWFSWASCPPTILPAKGGPSIPHSPARSTVDPFLFVAPFLRVWAALDSITICSSRLIPPALTRACLGWYLLRSRPWAGLQYSSGLSLRAPGRARATAEQKSNERKTFMLLDPVQVTESLRS